MKPFQKQETARYIIFPGHRQEPKKKKEMTEPVESVIICRQQKFELNNTLNPVEIEINDDRILNVLKKFIHFYYKFTPCGILFPSSITNNTKQIFVICRELNDTKVC